MNTEFIRAIVIGISFSAIFIACWTSRPASYGAQLEECNRNAKSCEESVRCENGVRAKYNRPARDLDAGCK